VDTAALATVAAPELTRTGDSEVVIPDPSTGPVGAGLPGDAVAAVGVSVIDPPVPGLSTVPLPSAALLSVGALEATVTVYPALPPVPSVTFHPPTAALTACVAPVSCAFSDAI
jgi:hypothetical protein